MARQYEVFRIARDVLVVVVQSDLLDAMSTRAVVPLLPLGATGKAIRGLNPEIHIGEDVLFLAPQLVATLRIAELGPPVGSIAHCRDEITRAMDILLSGI